MRKIILELIYTVFLVNDVCFCAFDENLKVTVDLIRNQGTLCSEFLQDLNQTSYPIYIHLKFPVMSKIINEQILSKEYKEEIILIENFINIFSSFISQLDKDEQRISKTEFRRNIKYFLIGLQQIQLNIKLIGLCLRDQFFDSDKDQADRYLCKPEFKLPNKNMKSINNRTYTVYWEPTICASGKNSVKFPFRLIYNLEQPTNTSMLIYFEFDIREFKLNQCESELHHCKEETTMCIYKLFQTDQLFATGNYYCKCRKGFFMGQSKWDSKGFPGFQVDKAFLEYDENNPIKSGYLDYNCWPCKPGCETCLTGKPCTIISNNILLRGLPLAFQSFCITLCVVTGIIVFQLRRTRVVKSSNWILLEFFLLGAISIYSMIINAYFKPTELTCAIQPFLREGGFVLMYGVLYVKVYRVLCSFQSRKAQRVYVRDQDILRYLGVLVIICFGHLIAWVATSFDHKKTSSYNTFTEIRKLSPDLDYILSNSCRSKYWDIISYLYETCLLAITIYYCKCVKSAPSEYGETRFITIAVINEFIISLLVIITRMTIMDRVYPDYIFLIYFLHCHATTTISLILLLGPKLWYLYRPPILAAGRPRLVPHSETHIIQTQQKLNGDVDLVEINLAEMDSETIRDELKRLYTQLEIYKTRAMRKDNPHVSRKKGGRKQRRFSLQHFHKKHHTSSGHDDETSKISEDSAGNSGGEEANLTSTSTK